MRSTVSRGPLSRLLSIVKGMTQGSTLALSPLQSTLQHIPWSDLLHRCEGTIGVATYSMVRSIALVVKGNEPINPSINPSITQSIHRPCASD